VGKRYLVPELLSGCRRAPIMSVGLNPNLRGATQPERIYPYFDDIQQYAKHFRYRTTFKYSIADDFYQSHLVDGIFVLKEGERVPMDREYVSMYVKYDAILTAFKNAINVQDADLSLGDDVSYYNFVVCHSPGWNMDSATEKGIVEECFDNRGFFRKQFEQSMPKAVIIFGKAIMKKFVAKYREEFDPNNVPDPNDNYANILANNKYVMTLKGKRIRVIFSPHPQAISGVYYSLNAQDRIVDALKEEYEAGNLEIDPKTKHFKRTDVDCKFCDNDIFYIGDCGFQISE